jgi:glycosyltransferase involved in cell wall biosynthesis
VIYIAIGEPDYWLRSWISKLVNRWMMGRMREILAVCEATRRQLVALDPPLQAKTHVCYTGVPDPMFSVRHGATEGPLRIVVLGSLSEEKDPLLALRAVSRVPRALLRFVGGGPLTEVVQDEIRALGMQARVELTGAVDDVIPHLEWGNLLLLTSRTEGLPGAVLEAGAASMPTVAVDVGGVSEAVSDGVSGFVVDRDDVDALVGALSRLASDSDLLHRMGRAARLQIKERFAMDHIIAGYAARLDEVLS